MVNKYNNTYHRGIKMRPVDLKPSLYINFDKENNKEDFKLVIMLEYQNLKTYLQKSMF